MPPVVWILIASVYLVASLSALIAYWRDKRAAERGQWRIRERTLHLLELAGGWPGALLARRLFRHKTRDQPFVLVLYSIIVLHTLAWGSWLWFVYVR